MLPPKRLQSLSLSAEKGRAPEWILPILLLLALAAGPGVRTEAGVTITPDSFADGADVVPGDAICDSDLDPGVTTCTLRAAIMETNALIGSDTIKLSSGTYTVTLVGDGEEAGDLNVLDALHIVGVPGTVIQAQIADRILHVNGAALEIEDLTLRDGDSFSNGGCLWTNSPLILRNVEMTGCESGGSGGAFHALGIGNDVFVERSWIHANSATKGGGIGIGNLVDLVIVNSTLNNNAATVVDGGAIFSTGDLYVTNCTIALNIADRSGGGIYSFNRIHLASSTVVGNWCDVDTDGDGLGCGVFSLNSDSFSRNTIIAQNLNWNSGLPVNEPDDCYGTFFSYGYNLVGYPGSDCAGFSATTDDLVGSPLLDPELGYLLDNGGPGPTLLPDPGSPIIDGGNPTGCYGRLTGNYLDPPILLEHEQRGSPRHLDDDHDGVARCNIGAVEGALFADGFESGTTDRWSATRP